MPTGYTCDVQSGKITEFKDFAIQCARAFGACIMMRDDPMDKPIPEKFEPDTYHKTALEAARTSYEEWKRSTLEQRLAQYNEEKAETIAHAKKQIEEDKVERERYEAMLAKVYEFQPPSSEHVKFKEFMVQQLTESIKFDCDGSYWQGKQDFPSFDAWVISKHDSLARDITYHSKEWKEEQRRAEERTRWIQQLRQSLTE